jgi:hypothetical protein
LSSIERASGVAGIAVLLGAACSSMSPFQNQCEGCPIDVSVLGSSGQADASSEAAASDGGGPPSLGVQCFLLPPDSCAPAHCREVQCSLPCTIDTDCKQAGHRCINNFGRLLCDPFCDSTACSQGSQKARCGGPCGVCEPVQCLNDGDCASNQTCLVEKATCVDRNVNCSATGACPDYAHLTATEPPVGCSGPRVQAYGMVACRGGACRFQQNLPTIAEAQSKPSISVHDPNAASSFMSAGDIVFSWDPQPHPTIALVVHNVPSTAADALDNAFWGYAAPGSFAGTVHWQDGRAIQGGQWTDASPEAPSGMLYLVVAAIEPGALDAISPPIPFAVGFTWKQLGDACTESSDFPDICNNPGLPPQVCYQGACVQACASDADCPGNLLCGGSVAKGGRIRLCGF